MNIYLIRHTIPEVEEGICYGQLDLDVKETFIKEANSIAQHVTDTNFDSIYSSPLIRCRKLANQLFPEQETIQDDRLMEMNFGDWEGNFWQSIPKKEMDNWANDFVTLSPPNGESFNQLLTRTHSFIESLDLNDKLNVAVVTHSGVIRSFLIKYLSIPADKIFNLQLDYGVVIKISYQSDLYQKIEFIK